MDHTFGLMDLFDGAVDEGDPTTATTVPPTPATTVATITTLESASSTTIQEQRRPQWILHEHHVLPLSPAPFPPSSDSDPCDVLCALLDNEGRHRPFHDFLNTVQCGELRPWMREKVVQWLFQVAEEFMMASGTVALAVNYLDRFLSIIPVKTAFLQLLASACLLIASKYAEVDPPNIDEITFLADGAFVRHDLVRMEELVVKILHWELIPVTPHNIVAALVSFPGVAEPDRMRQYCELFLDLLLHDYGFLNFLPSAQAAAAVLLASETMQFRLDDLPAQAWHLVHLDRSDVVVCTSRLRDLMQQRLFATETEVPLPPLLHKDSSTMSSPDSVVRAEESLWRTTA